MLLAPHERSSSRKRTELNRWKQLTRKPSPKVIHSNRALWGAEIGPRPAAAPPVLPPSPRASLPGPPPPWLPWSQHCSGGGGLGTLGSGYLTALVGSVVEKLFPFNAFCKPKRSGSAHHGEGNSRTPSPPANNPTILRKFPHISFSLFIYCFENHRELTDFYRKRKIFTLNPLPYIPPPLVLHKGSKMNSRMQVSVEYINM